MSGPIYLVTYFKPLPGKQDEVLEGIKTLAAAVEQNEPGALSYEVYWSEEDGSYSVAQKYADGAALEAHKTAAHFQEALKTAATQGSLAAAPTTKVLSRVAGFSR